MTELSEKLNALIVEPAREAAQRPRRDARLIYWPGGTYYTCNDGLQTSHIAALVRMAGHRHKCADTGDWDLALLALVEGRPAFWSFAGASDQFLLMVMRAANGGETLDKAFTAGLRYLSAPSAEWQAQTLLPLVPLNYAGVKALGALHNWLEFEIEANVAGQEVPNAAHGEAQG